MGRLYHLYVLSIVICLFFGISHTVFSQDVGVQNRPSLSVLILDVDENNSLDYSQFEFSQSQLSDRAFIDLTRELSIQNLNIGQDEIYQGNGLGGENYNIEEISNSIQEYLESSGFGNDIIRHQFMIDDNFEWSNDLLYERATFSQTIREAQAAITSERGAESTASTQYLDVLTRSYVLVIFPTVNKDEISIPYTNRVREVFRSQANAILFKIGYDSKDEVVANLGSLYCSEGGCEDKKEAFRDKEIPLDLVTYSLGGDQSTVVGQSMDGFNFLDQTLSRSLDIVVNNVPQLQLTIYVEDIKPIRSMVGLKEGVQRGRRYEVLRQSLDSEGEVSRTNRGYIRAKDVTDNRDNVVERDSLSGDEVIREFDPTIFTQIHGKRINSMDVIVESNDFGLLISPYTAIGSYNSVGLDVTYRIPKTLNIYGGLFVEVTGGGEKGTTKFWADKFGASISDTRTLFIQFGLAAKKDFFIARGNFRLTPHFAGLMNTGRFISSDSNAIQMIDSVDPSLRNFGVRFGSDFSYQFKVNFGVYGGLKYTHLFNAYTSEFGGTPVDISNDYSDYFKNYGLQLNLGFRVNF